MCKEKFIAVYEVPEAVSGDPYIRVPEEKDKLPQTLRFDRETGELITLWEEKHRYPYKTKVASRLYVRTKERLYKFDLRLDEKGSYIWNGSNIIPIFWTLLRISKDSPEGLQASKWHDNLLQFKQESYNTARYYNPDITVKEFRLLTTEIYKAFLRNHGIGKLRAWLMGVAINVYQFFNKQWRSVS